MGQKLPDLFDQVTRAVTVVMRMVEKVAGIIERYFEARAVR